MIFAEHSVANAPDARPKFEVADVFRAHGDTYRQKHYVSGEQNRVMRAIESCRTQALGGHLDVCTRCEFERPSYNSCRNRHCPKCQSLTQARWVEKRAERVLPTSYFHVVFTIPSELRTLIRANRVHLFNLLFAAAANTLIQLGDDPKRLGGRLGITAVLHTWTRELTFHPHLHCIVTDGGLAPKNGAWIRCNRRYLFPVKVLGALFRGKFLAGLRQLHKRGQLKYDGAASNLTRPGTFSRLLGKLYKTDWLVYAKKPFAGPEHIFRYLGRYTHRVGISNQRIQFLDENEVRFSTKNGKYAGLPPARFIARFLAHVLPKGFIKIRHFGLHASSNVHTKLQAARQAIQNSAEITCTTKVRAKTDEQATWQELLFKLTGFDPARCPSCASLLGRVALSHQRSRALDTS